MELYNPVGYASYSGVDSWLDKTSSAPDGVSGFVPPTPPMSWTSSMTSPRSPIRLSAPGSPREEPDPIVGLDNHLLAFIPARTPASSTLDGSSGYFNAYNTDPTTGILGAPFKPVHDTRDGADESEDDTMSVDTVVQEAPTVSKSPAGKGAKSPRKRTRADSIHDLSEDMPASKKPAVVAKFKTAVERSAMKAVYRKGAIKKTLESATMRDVIHRMGIKKASAIPKTSTKQLAEKLSIWTDKYRDINQPWVLKFVPTSDTRIGQASSAGAPASGTPTAPAGISSGGAGSGALPSTLTGFRAGDRDDDTESVSSVTTARPPAGARTPTPSEIASEISYFSMANLPNDSPHRRIAASSVRLQTLAIPANPVPRRAGYPHTFHNYGNRLPLANARPLIEHPLTPTDAPWRPGTPTGPARIVINQHNRTNPEAMYHDPTQELTPGGTHEFSMARYHGRTAVARAVPAVLDAGMRGMGLEAAPEETGAAAEAPAVAGEVVREDEAAVGGEEVEMN